MLTFVIWFVAIIVVIAIIVVGIKYLARVTGATIPPELLMILGLILFLVLLFALWRFVPLPDYPTRHGVGASALYSGLLYFRS